MFFTQDLHTHTNLSLCAKPDAEADAYLKLCASEGIDTLGFSDHFWDAQVPGACATRCIDQGWAPDFYEKQNFVHVNALRTRIQETYGIKVRFGCETEYCGCGKIGISRETAALMDFVLVPTSHTHMKGFTVPSNLRTLEDYRRIMIDRTIEVAEMQISEGKPIATGIAHPFCPLGCPDTQATVAGISDDDFVRCFTPCAKNGVALEINPDVFEHGCTLDSDGWPKEYRRMFIIARELGCKFYAGSDAHSPSRFLCHDRIRKFARACGMTEEDVFVLN